MDWVGIIGLVVSLIGIVAGAVWWAFRQGRGVGVAETVLKHEDESLNDRVNKIEDDIRQIFDMLQGEAFWIQMRKMLKETRSGTDRHERPAD